MVCRRVSVRSHGRTLSLIQWLISCVRKRRLIRSHTARNTLQSFFFSSSRCLLRFLAQSAFPVLADLSSSPRSFFFPSPTVFIDRHDYSRRYGKVSPPAPQLRDKSLPQNPTFNITIYTCRLVCFLLAFVVVVVVRPPKERKKHREFRFRGDYVDSMHKVRAHPVSSVLHATRNSLDDFHFLYFVYHALWRRLMSAVAILVLLFLSGFLFCFFSINDFVSYIFYPMPFVASFLFRIRVWTLNISSAISCVMLLIYHVTQRRYWHSPSHAFV